MSRERRAVAAFLVLALVAAVPALMLRSRPPAAAQARSARPYPVFGHFWADGSSRPTAPSTERANARRMASEARDAATAARRARARASTCTTVPLYPLALRIPQAPAPTLVRELARVPGVPALTRMEGFTLGHEDWLGNGVADVFTFYARRMRPIGFEVMPFEVRREIGVRPAGSVDSPELLYANRNGAALVQGLAGGEVRLTLFCGPAEATVV